ncbi:glycosyltransferase family 4 protein [Nocardia brasiliensis]
MRIAIYTNRMPIRPTGGIPRVLDELGGALRHAGAEVDYVLPNLVIADEAAESETSSQHAIEQDLLGRWQGGVQLADLMIRCAGADLRPDLVSLNGMDSKTIHSLISGYDALMVLGSALLFYDESHLAEVILSASCPVLLVIPFPLAEMEFYFGRREKTFLAGHISRVARSCAAVIAPSKYVRAELLSSCALPVPPVVVPFGVHEELFAEVTKPVLQPRLITTSRMTPYSEHKNLGCLLDLMPALRRRIPVCTLTLVGSGDHVKPLPDGVDVAGELTDTALRRLLSNSRAFVLPSSIEAFGLAAAEALAAGTPVVALRAGAIPDLVHHGVNGLLVGTTQHDRVVGNETVRWLAPDPDDLLLALSTVLADDDMYLQLHSRCRSSVNALRWGRTAATLIHLTEDAQAAPA